MAPGNSSHALISSPNKIQAFTSESYPAVYKRRQWEIFSGIPAGIVCHTSGNSGNSRPEMPIFAYRISHENIQRTHHIPQSAHLCH